MLLRSYEQMIAELQNIYKKMGDSLSKKIYIDRLNYSVTSDKCYIKNIVDNTMRCSGKWQKFCMMLKEKAEHSDMYIFGAGIWGNILYSETKNLVKWKAVIDSYPEGKGVGKLPVISMKELLNCIDSGIMVAVSSYKNAQEMSNTLQEAGIAQERIIDAGAVIYELTEGAIYFDLKQLDPKLSYEVFVDAGCYDGFTAKSFLQWCSQEGYVYCFEPDSKNVANIRSNLSNYAGKYELIEKALWSETKSLCIDVRGNYASSVRESDGIDKGQMVEAAALDDYLAGRPVTYIKMDVEGAEAEVLSGAKNLISSQRPRLAVSVYHKAEDIWILPKLILSYYPEYQFFLRHYSFSDYDTVLYALP